MATMRQRGDWDARLREIGEKLEGNPYVKVGFPEGSQYDDGTSLPLVAAMNEFGRFRTGRESAERRAEIQRQIEEGTARHIQPPRPFMRNTMAAHKSEWPRAIGKLLAKHDMDAMAALAEAGEGIKSQIQQEIQNLREPKLARSTVRRKERLKRFDPEKPLMDTGFMNQNIAVETGKDDE